jgi:hypothetical protein
MAGWITTKGTKAKKYSPNFVLFVSFVVKIALSSM